MLLRCLAWCLVGWFTSTAIAQSVSTTPTPAASVNWERLTDKAAWQARDSSGELVFGGKIWLLGGWFDSFAAPPRDVWSSTDGRSWELVTPSAPWRYSDLPMTVTFKDRMWIMGGWTNGRLAGHGATSEVWSSTDGREWKNDTQAAAWSPRLAAGIVHFKDRMWILGGTENYYFGDAKSLKNDVWSSADGVTWQQETAAAAWSPRAYHQAVVLEDRIWVMGGGNYVPEYHALNDVWSSRDGINWERATEHAAWSPRLWFPAVTYRDRMWVLGGWSNNPSRNWGDCWYSKDGVQWDELKTTNSWKERHEHSAYVHNDQLTIAGGHAQPLSNEVWTIKLPKEF